MTPDVFDAIANPIRRQLLAQLKTGPKPVNQLASAFDRGRPAISEHLKVLRDAGLVVDEARGRERFYRLRAEPLRALAEWLAEYERFWESKLENLSDLLDEEEDR